jgi:hypothetical protein
MKSLDELVAGLEEYQKEHRFIPSLALWKESDPDVDEALFLRAQALLVARQAKVTIEKTPVGAVKKKA